LLIVLVPVTAFAQSTARTATYDTLDTIVLPRGDSHAGRQAFLDLKCHLCHRVAGETSFSPIAELQGPMLNATLQQQSAAEIASAIIAPSHSLSVRTSESVKARMWEQGMSPMGDFSRVLTVRQLADLVAYFRSLR
jgi:mono/diheme cytochrome c family protein